VEESGKAIFPKVVRTAKQWRVIVHLPVFLSTFLPLLQNGFHLKKMGQEALKK
jgi:hypothetical protein